MAITVPSQLSDQDLLVTVQRAAHNERHATAEVIALLIELDARRLYLQEGYSSLFTYCTQVLHLSEHAAYGRIEAARAGRRYPVILELLAHGSINLTTVTLLGPHLTPDNHREVLESARHKSKRDVEHLIAKLRPQPDVPSTVRKLPPQKAVTPPLDNITAGEQIEAPRVPSLAVTTRRPPEVKPLAPERYKIQFTVSRKTYEQLRRAQDLLRHTIPNGDPGAIFERALSLLVADLSRTKLAAAQRPRPARPQSARSRHIPASVKRSVWQRDSGRCAFNGTHGRCTETGFLEYHHVIPFAAGGKTTADNLELRCRAHNAYEAEQFFGDRHLEQPSLLRETRDVF